MINKRTLVKKTRNITHKKKLGLHHELLICMQLIQNTAQF